MTADKQTSDNAFEEFTWRVENFSKLNSEKLYSETFIIDGFTWRILIFPRGNNVNNLSVYLDAADSATLPKGWNKFASFKIKIINQVDIKMDITKELKHHFCSEESDWGIKSVISLSELHDPANGYLLKDTCIIVVEISVDKPANQIVVYQAANVTTPLKSDDQVGLLEVETPQEDQGRDVSPVAPLSQENTEPMKLVDFRVMGQMEEAFVPLLEDVCLGYPSLIECQLKHTRNFREWAFLALGRVLHFLKTKKRRDMNDNACKDLQILWDELKAFGFDLNWLEPRVQSAFSMNTYLERAEQVKRLKENVSSLEMKMKSLKANIAAVEIDLEIARQDLGRAEEGFEEKDIDDELGY